MPFASEANLRLHLQLTDTTLAPADLLNAAIATAHERITPLLVDVVDQQDPPALLVHGETLLAGAATLRALATRDAAIQKSITIGGQRVEPGGRFTALHRAADRLEAEAWELLAEFLVPTQHVTPLQLTPSQSL